MTSKGLLGENEGHRITEVRALVSINERVSSDLEYSSTSAHESRSFDTRFSHSGTTNSFYSLQILISVQFS